MPLSPTGPDYALIRLSVTRVELMDFAGGIHPDPYGLVPAVAVRREAWELERADRVTDG